MQKKMDKETLLRSIEQIKEVISKSEAEKQKIEKRIRRCEAMIRIFEKRLEEA